MSMTASERALSVDLLTALLSFLKKPVIKLELCPAEEVAALQIQIQDLMSEMEEQKKRYKCLEQSYGREVGLNCQYEDLFRAHGIKFRK